MGGEVVILANSLISHFQWGLRHSALAGESGFSFLILFVFLFCCKFLLQQGEEQGGEVDGDAGEPLGDGDVDGP